MPDKAQHNFALCQTKPDYWYEKAKTAIYIDGPAHEYPDRRERDEAQQECTENMGVSVLRFAEGEQWLVEINNHPQLFGRISENTKSDGKA